jgi:hypothetical protein
MRMKLARRVLCGAVVSLFFAAGAPGATPGEVDAAILKARSYLYKQQNADANWELAQKRESDEDADVKGWQWGGLTAIATYAQIAGGEDGKSPRLAKAIDFLRDAKIQGIYALGLRAQVWLLLNDKKLRPVMERDKGTLLAAIHGDIARRDELGFYAYYFDRGPKPLDWYDLSVSQYGVLGVWALEQAGLEVPTKYWQVVDMAWRRAQHRDGGWSYRRDDSPENANSSATMTAAGVATLFITQDYTLGNIGDCRGNVTNANIEGGLAWMDEHIGAALSSGNFYGMYGIERIGVASGRKYFKDVDWYQAGADYLVKNQEEAGSWGGNVPDTCFAMLFLSRGRAPVAMNKLEYSLVEKNGKSAAGPWNERPRDCANFARWMGRNIEHDLNWQIVNLKVGAEELHDAPLLYISGNKDLTFSEADTNTLRAFAEQGGLILGNADCGHPNFAKSFEKLGGRLFPKYEFRELPPGHVIFTGEQYFSTKWPSKPKVRGLSNGVRELMLLIPEADLSRAWQSRSNERIKEENYQLGANIFLYSVDKKNLREKGATYLVKEDPQIQTTRSIELARLQVGENPNPEPAGWPRLAAILHNQYKVALTVKEVKCEAEALKGIRIAHLTGTTKFALSEEQRKVLKDFVEAGGTLIVDAAGGNSDFAFYAEAELKTVFGSEPKLLPPQNPVFDMPDAKIDQFPYRAFARRLLVGTARTARVKAIEVKGRLAVFFSAEDLSAGLVGEPVDGIMGYEPATATAVMRNLVLFGAFGAGKKG